MKIQSLKKSRGFTLIEIGIVVAAIFLLTIAITAAVGSFNESANVKTAGEDLTNVYAAAQKWKLGRASYKGLTITVLDTQDYTSGRVGGGTGTNPWGGNYTAGPVSGTPANLEITATGVNGAACAQLADKFSLVASSAACASGTVTITYNP